MKETEVQLGVLGLRLLQRSDFFGFSEDSLALAEFIQPNQADNKICDLGSGSGGLILLLWAKNQQADCFGLEIMPQNVELARRSLQLNAHLPELLQKCHFWQGDWRTPWQYFAPHSIDLLVSNPPYQPAGSGRLSPYPERAAARTELFGSLAGLLASAAWLLRPAGRLALVLPQNRQAELKKLLAGQNFLVKRQQNYKKLLLLEAQASDK